MKGKEDRGDTGWRGSKKKRSNKRVMVKKQNLENEQRASGKKHGERGGGQKRGSEKVGRRMRPPGLVSPGTKKKRMRQFWTATKKTRGRCLFFEEESGGH